MADWKIVKETLLLAKEVQADTEREKKVMTIVKNTHNMQEKAIPKGGKKPKKKKERMVVPVDHKGVRYETINQMCEHWGVSIGTFRDRYIRQGLSIEESLLKGKHVRSTHSKMIMDPYGNIFGSMSDMADFHGVTMSILYKRLTSGWGLMEALNKSMRRLPKDYKKVPYNGVASFTVDQSKNGILKNVDGKIYQKADNGYVFDHEGNAYKNMATMCYHYKTTEIDLSAKLISGMSLKKALTGK